MLAIEGKSLIARAVKGALKSRRMRLVYISTDCSTYEEEAVRSGAKTVGLRPPSISASTSPDVEWMKWSLGQITDVISSFGLTHLIVLRPTSPFRSTELIDEAINYYEAHARNSHTVLRCVSRVSQHPAKMWVKLGASPYMRPLLPLCLGDVPYCDSQTALLFDVYIQNAAIEIIPVLALLHDNMPSSGYQTLMFEWNGIEVLDINTPQDIVDATRVARELGL